MEKHGHLGVHDQAEDGLNYIGVGVPVGRLTTDQMETVAHIMEEYGQDDVRFTIFQSLMIPGIADEDVETVKGMIEDCGLTYNESNVKGGVVACTGNVGCKFAMTDTKGQALELSQYLNDKLDLDHPINIHLTGCPNSCAQHYCGDIGLLGVTAKDDDGESVEAYDIALGGGMDEEHGLGRDVVSSVPFDEVPPLLEDMLETYLDERESDDETFVEFTRRHDVDELKSMFADS
jgi:ferredoxin-nitrite reductase